ncbi:MAG TPA: Na+/H+ antiporter NhaC family protein [Bacillales bacterium]|nr:Na+/H+ antiporter NhaC family protein [Bacillales bacterium]
MESFGFLSFLPVIVALGLAIWTKRVIESLLLGILTGTIMLDISQNGVIHAILFSIVNLFQTIAGHPPNEELGLQGIGLVKSSGRAEIIVMVLLLGAFITVLDRSGGAFAFGEWLAKKVKGKKGAQVSTALMGSSLFTSAYFSSLATGTVFRPIYDRMKISREKLAFFLDSTASPINVIIPISGWVAFMGALMTDNIPSVDDPIAGLVKTIPFNFYNIVMLIMVYLVAAGKIGNFGPMKKAEERAQAGHISENDAEDPAKDVKIKNGKVSDMLLPLGVSIVALVVMGLWNYTITNFTDVPKIPFGGNMMLIVSFVLGLIVAFIKYTASKLMGATEFLDMVIEGTKSAIFGGMVIVLAVTLGDIIRTAPPEGVGAAIFLKDTVADIIPQGIIPVAVFVIAAFMSFSIGTSFGTWAIMMPIAVPLALATGGDPFLAAAAVLSGGTFGDHSSPISDTTIMSSIGASCNHMGHVNTQLPYALTSASIAAVLFLIAGFVI